MAYDKDLLIKLGEAIANTDTKKEYYYDKKDQKIIEISGKKAPAVADELHLVKIEPMLADIAELMEDFTLEQDAEDVQERLLKFLRGKDTATNINSFKRAIFDYPRSKKSWDRLESKWIKERAIEFLDDIER